MLTRWRDFGSLDWTHTLKEFDTLRQEMNRFMSDRPQPRIPSAAGFPRIGLFEQPEALVLYAEVPGVGEDDLDITVDEGTLTLRGKRGIELPEGYAIHRQERAEATFARSFSLPCKVDLEKTEAKLNQGVLKLTLPKAPELKPRQISVSVG